MSSEDGIFSRRTRGGRGGVRDEHPLRWMVSTILRVGQARTTLALFASVGLFYCLNTWRDPLRFVASGGVGLGALSLALSREPSTRLLFGGTAFMLLGLYAWAGTETVHLDITLNGNHLAARAGEMTLE